MLSLANGSSPSRGDAASILRFRSLNLTRRTSAVARNSLEGTGSRNTNTGLHTGAVQEEEGEQEES